MWGTPLRNLDVFRNLCGEDALQNVILVTTMWGSISSEVGESREALVRTEFWRPMLALGCRMDHFEDTHQSAWDIIGKLDIKNRHPIKLEMVDQDNFSQTSAFAVLARWWERTIAKLRNMLHGIDTRPETKGPRLGIKDDHRLEQKRKMEEEVQDLGPGQSFSGPFKFARRILTLGRRTFSTVFKFHSTRVDLNI
jgi:hypothetical protein